jgi:hypothetical protein
MPSSCLSSISDPSNLNLYLNCSAVTSLLSSFILNDCPDSFSTVCSREFNENPPFTCSKKVFNNFLTCFGSASANGSAAFSILVVLLALFFSRLYPGGTSKYRTVKGKYLPVDENKKDAKKDEPDKKGSFCCTWKEVSSGCLMLLCALFDENGGGGDDEDDDDQEEEEDKDEKKVSNAKEEEEEEMEDDEEKGKKNKKNNPKKKPVQKASGSSSSSKQQSSKKKVQGKAHDSDAEPDENVLVDIEQGGDDNNSSGDGPSPKLFNHPIISAFSSSSYKIVPMEIIQSALSDAADDIADTMIHQVASHDSVSAVRSKPTALMDNLSAVQDDKYSSSRFANFGMSSKAAVNTINQATAIKQNGSKLFDYVSI